jgi:hypothetical protein
MWFWLLIFTALFSLVFSVYFENAKWDCCKPGASFRNGLFGDLVHDHEPRISITKNRWAVSTLPLSYACLIAVGIYLWKVYR